MWQWNQHNTHYGVPFLKIKKISNFKKLERKKWATYLQFNEPVYECGTLFIETLQLILIFWNIGLVTKNINIHSSHSCFAS